jgi:small neutral amino acid transporter SnatA (MarC family)
MLLAKPIMSVIRLAPLQILGWIFCVLQAGLAVQAVVNLLQHMRVAS